LTTRFPAHRRRGEQRSTEELKQSSVRSTQTGDQKPELQRSLRTCLLFEQEASDMAVWTAERPIGIVAGIGCTSTASAGEIGQLLDKCLAEAGYQPTDLTGIASHPRRSDHQGLKLAAAAFGVPLRFPDCGDNVAESAAETVGPLVLGKRKSARVTCALAIAGDPYSAGARFSAATAAGTLSTSGAGA
jgi:cobalamin biosynthesis protein CbiG